MSTSRYVAIGKFLIAERSSQSLLVATKYCKNRHVIDQKDNFCRTCGDELSISGEFIDDTNDLCDLDVTDPTDKEMVEYWTGKQIFPDQELMQQFIAGTTSLLNCFILRQDDYIDANEETITMIKHSENHATQAQVDWLYSKLEIKFSTTVSGTIVYHC